MNVTNLTFSNCNIGVPGRSVDSAAAPPGFGAAPRGADLVVRPAGSHVGRTYREVEVESHVGGTDGEVEVETDAEIQSSSSDEGGQVEIRPRRSKVKRTWVRHAPPALPFLPVIPLPSAVNIFALRAILRPSRKRRKTIVPGCVRQYARFSTCPYLFWNTMCRCSTCSPKRYSGDETDDDPN